MLLLATLLHSVFPGSSNCCLQYRVLIRQIAHTPLVAVTSDQLFEIIIFLRTQQRMHLVHISDWQPLPRLIKDYMQF